MSSTEELVVSRKRKRESAGPYTLRPLVESVPLSADGELLDIRITCVEYWDNNLYIGTSAAEILHFVSLPAEVQDASQQPTFILASRLEPTPTSSAKQRQKGVQQIVLLPRVNKACILCNGVLTFYTLPELSPAFGNTKVSNCSRIGARDLDLGINEGGEGEIIMVCVKNRIRLVRIGEEPRLVKNIEYPGCLAGARRSHFACVADAHSYALLDVENQQKIPLFPISSVDEEAANASERRMDVSSTAPQIGRSVSSALSRSEAGHGEPSSHSRSTSLGAFVSGLGRLQPGSRSRSRERLAFDTPDAEPGTLSPLASPSPTKGRSYLGSPSRAPATPEKPLPPPPEDVLLPKTQNRPPGLSGPILTPHICSHLPTEFLLTTGTTPDEPGVGIFVNYDGDVVRGTLEFSQYPRVIIVDGGDPTGSTGHVGDSDEGYVLAAVERTTNGTKQHGIEIQRWDVADQPKAWLSLSDTVSKTSEVDKESPNVGTHIGLGTTLTAMDMSFPEAGARLRSRRLKIPTQSVVESQSSSSSETESEPALQDWEVKRNSEEDEFASRLGQSVARVVVWEGPSVNWAVRNPLVLRLDSIVDRLLEDSLESRLDQARLLKVLRSIRDQEARNETDFLSLGYIRQKISIVLFAELAANRYDVNPQINEHVFLEGGLDPRVMLSMVPLLRKNIVEGKKGVWVHAGLINLIDHQLSTSSISIESDEVLARPEEYDLLSLIKRYLTIWRQRKGFGSVADEAQVFATVDAALLHVLLYQDQQSFSGPGSTTSVRAELYSIVDSGVDCFDRAIELFEEHRRLYVLSRLYQSRKMSARVLETWRRILEGERDDGGEFVDGENEVRKYLVRIKDVALVEEYGTWLARRTPALGVQVFTDDNSRVKLPPNQVVQLLQLQAPDAVKVFLEHLVFGKKNVQYANDLISYYLDSVLTMLKSSEQARATLEKSYETYRALHQPKPTYRQFITENAIPDPWWHDRLRLLELIGGSHGAGFSYNVATILTRISPFEASLVPEAIILDGRQGHHEQALRLLTHGLGDYHTAINYCLLGGSSIFHPTAGRPGTSSSPPPTHDEQAALFRHLFSEFLRIEDASDRIERTGELLERFGSWFDVAFVLARVPDEWSVELLSAFLVGALRRLVAEKSEAMIVKALSGAENLIVSAAFVEKCEGLGPKVGA